MICRHIIWRNGERIEFGGNLGGLGRPDPLEDLQRLPQPVFCLGGMAAGQSAPAQAGLRMGLPRHSLKLRPGMADQLQRTGQQPGRLPPGGPVHPRSKSLTDLGLNPAASASSS